MPVPNYVNLCQMICFLTPQIHSIPRKEGKH